MYITTWCVCVCVCDHLVVVVVVVIGNLEYLKNAFHFRPVKIRFSYLKKSSFPKCS